MTSTTIDAARRYIDEGWSPIPLPAGKKWPPPNGVTGWNGRYTTAADLGNGWDWTGNVGIRLPADVVGIDIDVYHGGDRSLAELEQRYGPLPPSRWSTSRTDGSGIALYRVPAGTVLHTDPAEGIDIVQSHHRYVVCHPSIHPDTGQQYRWLDEQDDDEIDGPGEIGDLPDLPWPWIEGLRAVKEAGANAATPIEAQEFVERHTTCTRPGALKGIRSRLAEAKPGGRHDALVTAACWAMREAAAGLYSADDAIAAIHGWWINAIEDPRRREGGEFGAAVMWAIGQAETDPARIEAIKTDDPFDGLTFTPNGAHPPTTGEIATGRNLPPDFWNARHQLAHIRDAAHARARSADAVLLFALARACATIPPNIKLPPITGGAASLNFLGAVIGTSGAGKSSAGAVARELVPITRKDVLADLPLGSGEGIAERYFEWVLEEQSDGKNKRVKRQTRTGLYMYLDEGQALGEMGNRKGATLMPTLRAGWSGETIGNTNASEETFRVVPAHTYRLALMVGFQAEYAVNLIAEGAAAGDPQRFVFASAVDPNVPNEPADWPGVLELWTPPAGHELFVEVAGHIRRDVYMRNVMATQGRIEVDPLDSHRDLVRLKLAALLGFLDGRIEVNDEDWQLAEQVVRASAAVRQWVIEIGRFKAAEKARASVGMAVARERAVQSDAEKSALESGAKSIGRRAHRVGTTLAKRDLHAAVSSRHKHLVSVDDMIEFAESEGWITPVVDGWKPGESKPA